MIKTATYGERVRPVDVEKVKAWKDKQKKIGTFNYIAEMCFRSRAVIHNAINLGSATESTEKNIDSLFNKTK